MGQQGFTLLELIITLAVVAILSAIALPGFDTFIRNNRLTTQANAFVSALSLARSEAIKRGSRVVVCKSADGKQCSKNNGFEQGWIVFADSNNNATVDPSDEIIRVFAAMPVGMTLTGNRFISDYISYTADGINKSINNGPQDGTLTLCQETGNPGRQIIVGRRGRVQVQTLASCP
jgi:type IV fimbrial biogenesis protein FimT